MTTEAPIIVIGAGIVGTATARALQRDGHRRHPARQRRARQGDLLRQRRLHRHRPRAAARPAVDPEARAADADGSQRPAHRASAQPSRPAALDGALRALRPTARPKCARASIPSALLMAEANIAWKAEIQASGLGELFKSHGALYVYESEALVRGRRRGARAAEGQGHRVRDRRRQPRPRAGARPRPATSCAASTTRTACTPSIRTAS